ncbi:unnamed protein product [Gongylonema pulchrum]|uniref:BBS2_N domain-containing protein n=1 Tax=Gongylonema pulchrum TaxID=637853 RepID=A0A183E5W4_9BILA|nr:unnamed protein product [Gongylonema pulchrum]
MLGLRSEFSYGIPHHVVSGCAKFGVLDVSGKTQLIVATTTNKVAIHDSETLLNINEKILALEVTQLETTYDVIIVGTASRVLAYDAYKNTNIFQRDITDGVNCIHVGFYNVKFAKAPKMYVC